MILTDGTNTYTNLHEDIKEAVISNSSSSITIGGQPKQQADSQRLRIDSTVRVPKSEWPSLNAILINYGASLTYTPVRALAYKTTAAAMGVVVIGGPKIKERAYNGEVIFYVTIEMEEDPFA